MGVKKRQAATKAKKEIPLLKQKRDAGNITIDELLKLALMQKPPQNTKPSQDYMATVNCIIKAIYSSSDQQKNAEIRKKMDESQYADLTSRIKTELAKYTSIDFNMLEKTRKNTQTELTALIAHYDEKIISLKKRLLDLNGVGTWENDVLSLPLDKKHANALAKYNAVQGKFNSDDINIGSSKKFQKAATEFRHLNESLEERDTAQKSLEQYQEKRKTVEHALKSIKDAPQEKTPPIQKSAEYNNKLSQCAKILDDNQKLLLKEADSRELKLLGCVAAGLTGVGLVVMAGLSIYSKVTKGTWDFLAPESNKAVKVAEDIREVLPATSPRMR